jgi:hypothetical protein
MAHGDYTGQSKAVLAQQHAQQQRLAAKSTTLVNQIVEEGRAGVIDLFTDLDNEWLELSKQPVKDGDVEEYDQNLPVGLEPVKFKASETLTEVTVGKDRQFNLEAGQVYKAPRWVVDHLDEKQLVWH